MCVYVCMCVSIFFLRGGKKIEIEKPKKESATMPLIYFYKIVCNNQTLYVGSAIHFNERQRLHQLACESNNTKRVYQAIREKGGWNKVSINLLERPYCIDAEQRRAREQYWIEVLEPQCNMRRAYSKGIAI